ncbi:xyloside xylosyltransferase 1-like [Limulus polyphemus]|uniref:Xyloside xylosyltransferase 1-like n=1 Tax=Limulus polyphemus TaxID=6850 RepID=A0ABM1SKW9_LIMPO|nr:xyloside xylosyltransferase 1-like [Limulus polyphemus]
MMRKKYFLTVFLGFMVLLSCFSLLCNLMQEKLISVSRRTTPIVSDRNVSRKTFPPQTLVSPHQFVHPTEIVDPYQILADQVHGPSELNVAFTANNAYNNIKIIRRMQLCLRSLLRLTNSPIHFHAILDVASVKRVARTLKKIAYGTKRPFKVSYLDVDVISKNHQDIIKVMRKYFFTKNVTRYNDNIFFISEIFHRVFHFKKLIFIDLDLRFEADILDLYLHFEKFHKSQIMAIANDLQPQYRVDFEEYRRIHPGTDVGSARPGKQGFNTGVVLFHLERMRKSSLYNSLLKEDLIEALCFKYKFKGYLGHQDFFTLIGMEYPELYYTLDCTWNRQLDTAWLKTVNATIFEPYHICPGTVKIYHGNGDTFIPIL